MNETMHVSYADGVVTIRVGDVTESFEVPEPPDPKAFAEEVMAAARDAFPEAKLMKVTITTKP
jgi:hypothetical protein